MAVRQYGIPLGDVTSWKTTLLRSPSNLIHLEPNQRKKIVYKLNKLGDYNLELSFYGNNCFYPYPGNRPEGMQECWI